MTLNKITMAVRFNSKKGCWNIFTTPRSEVLRQMAGHQDKEKAFFALWKYLKSKSLL